MQVENKYAPLIHDNASLLLRPKTGLNDMVVEVDPGTTASPEVKEGSTLPLASTQPQVNPDEILSSLDADTQQFLKLLLANGAEALDPAKGRDVKLSNALRRLDPFARDIARISGALAVRRENIARSIHNFQLLSTELGNHDQDLTNFVDSSNAVLGALRARGGLDPRRPPRAARHSPADPGRPDQRQRPRASIRSRAQEADPGSRRDRPGPPRAAPLFQQTVAPIQNQIRPFTRQVRQSVTDLTGATPGPRQHDAAAQGRPSPASTRRLNAARLQPGRAPTRASSSTSPGSTTTPTCSSPSRTPTARCGAGWCWSPASPPSSRRARSSPPPSSTRWPSSPPFRIRPTCRDAADGTARTDTRPDRRRGGIRLLVLRPAALPLDDLRRPGPAEARGLPDQGPVQ